MRDIDELVEGYRRFLAGRYPQEAERYRTLAEEGQSPSTMIIACCDSRADPATIFSAGPGQYFIVRNVANLVPPFEPEGAYHGTSAALEFAVTGLGVSNIVVMGHARCGGVRAFLDTGGKPDEKGGFIDRWISLLVPAYAEVGEAASEVERQEAMEYAAVRQSLKNLETFPFVAERLAAGKLRLRGAYFDIADGRLQALDPATGRFSAVT